MPLIEVAHLILIGCFRAPTWQTIAAAATIGQRTQPGRADLSTLLGLAPRRGRGRHRDLLEGTPGRGGAKHVRPGMTPNRNRWR
jgi:hypothetical protein